MVNSESFNEFVAWAKRRGVIWPSSQIYGGLGSTYDYGPVGAEMKRRLKDYWWRTMVLEREDVVGIDTAIIMNPKVWEASGHTGEGFADLMVEDLVTHKRYRADQLDDLKKSPDGNPMTEPRRFNILMKTFIGPVEDSQSTAYLRGETCQGIFINFKQVLETSRLRPPFGIAQIGKAFRNEITPGNLTFRTLEFDQMELEFFVPKEEADEWFDYWLKERFQWYVDLGIEREHLRLRKHSKDALAHYSKATTDIEYKFPWGWGELEGLANRGDYDLTQHQKFSGKDMSVYDENTGTKFMPWVIEPSGGVDRALLVLLLEAWQFHEKGRPTFAPSSAKASEGKKASADKKNDESENTSEILFSINPQLSAYDAAVLPLIKKAPLIKIAEKLVKQLREAGKRVFYDESGSIGRRYRRQDEIGTPICYTVDFDSMKDKKVTSRDRDSMTQKRILLTSLGA